MSGLRTHDARHALGVHRALEAAIIAWHDSSQGLRDLIAGLAGALDCPAGSVWTFDAASQSLACRELAAAPGSHFEPAPGRVVAERDSLPSRVWATGAPVAAAMDVAGRDGVQLRGALAFPIAGTRSPIAVLALHATSVPELGPELTLSLVSAGRALGSFIEDRRDPVGTPLLTAREIDVLQLAADGLTGPAIADRLVLSRLTVKSHFAHIYRKLGTIDRANAVASAMRGGLIR